jgi:hypothetical protein
MSPPLSWSWQNDIEVLRMGEIEVGRVSASGGKKGAARFIFNLLGHRAFWRDEKTVERAKLALTCELSAWLRKAGLQ